MFLVMVEIAHILVPILFALFETHTKNVTLSPFCS